MKLTYDIYFAESPLQLINIISAKKTFSSKNQSLLILRLNNSKNNDTQIIEIAKKSWVDEKLIIKIPNNKYKYILYLYNIFRIYKKIKNYKIDKIFIGEFRSEWMQIIRLTVSKNSAWMVDDGMNTFDVIKTYINNMSYTRIPFINKFRNPLNKPINIFSVYEDLQITNNEVEFRKNELAFIRDFNDKLKIDHNNFYFFGQTMSEVGYFDTETELKMIERIKDYVKNELSLEIIYVAHRGSSEDKLKKISMIVSKVIKPTIPSEIYFLYNSNELPTMIGTFNSSILYNMKKIYNNNIKLTISFIFNESLIQDKKLIGPCLNSNQFCSDFADRIISL